MFSLFRIPPSCLGLAISDKKNYFAEDGIDKLNGYSIYDGISDVPQNRKFSEFSLNHSAEEKNGQYSVPLNRNRNRRFVPNHIEEKNSSEFHSVEQK